MTPEGRTKNRLKAWIAERDCYAVWPVQTGYGAATLDCLLCYAGQFWGIETKREGICEPTERQRETMRRMRQAGARTFLVTIDENKKLKWIEVK